MTPKTKGVAGGFYDIRDHGEFVNLHDPLNLSKAPVREVEIAACDPSDCCDRLYLGEIRVVEIDAGRPPMPGQRVTRPSWSACP